MGRQKWKVETEKKPHCSFSLGWRFAPKHTFNTTLKGAKHANHFKYIWLNKQGPKLHKHIRYSSSSGNINVCQVHSPTITVVAIWKGCWFSFFCALLLFAIEMYAKCLRQTKVIYLPQGRKSVCAYNDKYIRMSEQKLLDYVCNKQK